MHEDRDWREGGREGEKNSERRKVSPPEVARQSNVCLVDLLLWLLGMTPSGKRVIVICCCCCCLRGLHLLSQVNTLLCALLVPVCKPLFKRSKRRGRENGKNTSDYCRIYQNSLQNTTWETKSVQCMWQCQWWEYALAWDLWKHVSYVHVMKTTYT